MNNSKDKYSLWIVPKGKSLDVLQSLVSSLAIEYGSNSFTPHITLVAGLSASEAEYSGMTHRIQQLTVKLSNFTVALYGYGFMDEEHRCLYLHASGSELSAVYQTASELFPQVSQEHFRAMPHASVLYGKYTVEEKQRMITENPLPKFSFEADELSLYITNGPADNWKLAQTFPFAN